MSTILKLFLFILVIFCILILGQCYLPKPDMAIFVDCDKSESLAEAVQAAHEGDKFIVIGTCRENKSVVITQNNIVIDGRGNTIEGITTQPVITANAAKDVIIKNLIIKNGKNGLAVLRGAQVTAINVIITNNDEDGVVVIEGEGRDNPRQTPGLGIHSNDRNKISSFLSTSTFGIRDAIADSSNCKIIVNGVCFNGTTYTACNVGHNSNGGYGVYVDGAVIIAGCTSSCTDTVRMNDNGQGGIRVIDKGAAIVNCGRLVTRDTASERSQPDGIVLESGANIQLINNGVLGSRNNQISSLRGDGTPNVVVTCSNNNSLNLCPTTATGVSVLNCNPRTPNPC